MDFHNPNLAIGFAMAFGVISMAIAEHLRMPGIVVLLTVGVLLGPDVAGIIRPEALGPALMTLVGFAVAVILFDGGMNLHIGRIRREQRSIRQLITLGALVTTVGGALAWSSATPGRRCSASCSSSRSSSRCCSSACSSSCRRRTPGRRR